MIASQPASYEPTHRWWCATMWAGKHIITSCTSWPLSQLPANCYPVLDWISIKYSQNVLYVLVLESSITRLNYKTICTKEDGANRADIQYYILASDGRPPTTYGYNLRGIIKPLKQMRNTIHLSQQYIRRLLTIYSNLAKTIYFSPPTTLKGCRSVFVFGCAFESNIQNKFRMAKSR